MCNPCCPTCGICTPIEPPAKDICIHTTAPCLSLSHTHVPMWNYITLFLWTSPSPVGDSISNGGPTLPACRKWLDEEQTGRDSSKERLIGTAATLVSAPQGSPPPHTSTLHYSHPDKKHGEKKLLENAVWSMPLLPWRLWCRFLTVLQVTTCST